ncbi:MAG TPA: alpha/beta fold hydrolase [Candidatus Thermoplasmatota archaeon]|nr:alpha/beta fold hydrolase [Candidatus Thermoplasmatota archaeon]
MRLSAVAVVLLTAAVAAPSFLVPAQAASQTTGSMTSFDGTSIVYTLFLPEGASAESPVPAVLMTHGWAGSRTATPTGAVARLLGAGFAVLTWDSRGFGQSGGFVELDSPAYEVKDTMALVDLLAANDAILQDDAGDPRVGMTGGSYAGGIQLLTAAFDPRIDAITPDITWNDLRQSLDPNGVPKLLWVEALFGAGVATGTTGGLQNAGGPEPRSYDLNLPTWWAEAHATNSLTPEAQEGLRERSAVAWMESIRAPALITQGLPDTLFNPNEAVANYEGLRARGVDASLLLYCGGHAGCPYVADNAHVNEAVLDWLGHYLSNRDLGHTDNVEWQTNDGAWHTASQWPPVNADWKSASATITLASTPAPTGGGGFAVSAGGVGAQTPDAPVQDQTVTSQLVPIAQGPLTANGIGHVHLEVSGIGTEAFLFFRLVDATDGTVLDGQTQAFRVPVSPFSVSRADVDLVGVSYIIPEGHTLALQVSTSDIAHATNRQPGLYDIVLTVEVPTS